MATAGRKIDTISTGPPDPAGIETLLRDVPTVGGLLPALVTRTGAKEATVHVRGEGEVVLPFEGIEWARPYVNVDQRGPAPEKASDVLAPGDRIRVLRTGERWELAQVPEVQGALVAMDPEDGAILAMTGGFDFVRSKFNRGTQARRQPGSSFKPFIYASALARGFTAASLINDAPVVFDDPALEAEWRPENYSGKFFGPTRLREALVKSRNLVSIRLLREVGVDFALDYVERFGFDREKLPRSLSLALGSGEITPLESATAYSVLANGGFAVHPWFVDRIEDRRRETVLAAAPARVCRECRDGTVEKDGAAVAPRTVPAGDIWILQSILREVIRRGTGRKALALERTDLGGKTGTTNNQHDAWFCGLVPSLVAVAWVGFDDYKTLGRNEVGGRAALPMWIRFMRTALAGVPERIPPPPEGLVKVRINSGHRTARRCLRPGRAVRDVPRGQSADPSRGARGRNEGGSLVIGQQPRDRHDPAALLNVDCLNSCNTKPEVSGLSRRGNYRPRHVWSNYPKDDPNEQRTCNSGNQPCAITVRENRDNLPGNKIAAFMQDAG